LALATGESLAQVASQTLENMAVIQQAAALPILRPLVGMDKQEIIDQARRIGTFEISSMPDQDCCQLFVPKNPPTKSRLADVERRRAASISLRSFRRAWIRPKSRASNSRDHPEQHREGRLPKRQNSHAAARAQRRRALQPALRGMQPSLPLRADGAGGGGLG